MARGLEQVTLVECDVELFTDGLLEEMSVLGIAYVDVLFDAPFEIADDTIFTLLFGNNKVRTNSGRRELHLTNVVVSEGFFSTMTQVN